MSWSPDLFIGEFRPWPDSVHVVRGRTDETLRYVPEDFSAISRENIELRELVRDFYPFALGHAAKPWLAVRRDRMHELGVDV